MIFTACVLGYCCGLLVIRSHLIVGIWSFIYGDGPFCRINIWHGINYEFTLCVRWDAEPL